MKEDDKDNFQASLEQQYQEMIQEALLECETEHRTRLNLGKLQSKLQVIQKAAQQDGIAQAVIDRLITETIPPSTYQKAA